MAGEVKQTKIYGFSSELREFKSTGRLSESFFEKLFTLAEKSVRKNRYKPDQLGIPGHEWDLETVREVALDFLINHLASRDQRKLTYLVDRAQEGREVDFLMKSIFDQFLAELVRNRFPHRFNLRNRVRKTMEELVAQKKAELVPGRSDVWAPAGRASCSPVGLEDLERCAFKLPGFGRKKYDGHQRVSPEISQDDLYQILLSIIEGISGPVNEEALIEFLSQRLDIRDASFESVGFQTQGEEQGEDWMSYSVWAASLEHDPERSARMRRAFGKLTSRQKKILELYGRGDLGMEEIAEKLGIKKTVAYDELKKARDILKGELDE